MRYKYYVLDAFAGTVYGTNDIAIVQLALDDDCEVIDVENNRLFTESEATDIPDYEEQESGDLDS